MAIREYFYFCEKCAYQFSDYCDWDKVAANKPRCAMCKSNKEVFRDFAAENVGGNAGPKTVGALADLNSARGIRNEQEETERKKEVGFTVKDGRATKI